MIKGISINLLPSETPSARMAKERFNRIQFISAVVISIFILLASASFVLSLVQRKNVERAQLYYDNAKKKLTSLQDRERRLLVLKDRLANVSKYVGLPSKQREIYELFDKLSPQSVTIKTMTVDKSGSIITTLIIPDGVVIDDLVTNLLDKKQNQDKIAQISVDNLNRADQGYYQMNIKIKRQ